jgi:hypothetical protein
MPQSLPRVREGQAIKINPINDLVDAFNRVPAAFGNPGMRPAGGSGALVYCINKCGDDIDMGACAAVRKTHGDVLAQLSAYGPYGFLEKPKAEKRDEYNIAIASTKIKDGEGGLCYISGTCWARVSERVGDNIQRAGFQLDATENQYILLPKSSGPLMMLHYSDTVPVAGSGDYWAFVAFATVGEDYVLVQPDTDVLAYQVVGLGAALVDPSTDEDEFKDRVSFAVTTPDEDLHRAKYAVMLEDCESGELGKARIDGIIQVKIAMSETGHKFAEIDDGVLANFKSTNVGGARILWVESGTGTKWAIAHIGQTWNSVTAKAQSDGDGTVSVKLTNADLSGGTLTETGDAFTVVCPPAGS